MNAECCLYHSRTFSFGAVSVLVCKFLVRAEGDWWKREHITLNSYLNLHSY